MTSLDFDSDIDWTQCELIERVPGKVSGRPIVRDTRILPDAIVDSYDSERLSMNFGRGFRLCRSPRLNVY